MIGAFQLGVVAAAIDSLVAPTGIAFTTGGSNLTYSLANQKVVSTSTWQTVPIVGAIATTGKFYIEFQVDNVATSNGPIIGVMVGAAIVPSRFIGDLLSSGSASVGVSTVRAEGAGWSVISSTNIPTHGLLVGVSVDMDAGDLRWYVSGVIQPNSQVQFPAHVSNLHFGISSHPVYGGAQVMQSSANTPAGFSYFTGA